MLVQQPMDNDRDDSGSGSSGGCCTGVQQTSFCLFLRERGSPSRCEGLSALAAVRTALEGAASDGAKAKSRPQAIE